MFTQLRSRTLAAAALAIGMMSAPFAASADTVTYTNYSLTNAKNVTIVTPAPTMTVSAGRITLTGVKINGVGVANINAWCIDLDNTLAGMGTYGLGNVNDPAMANQLNALLTGASSIDLSSGNNSAALQVAVWKTVVANFSMNTSVANGADINTLSNTFLSWVADPTQTAWKASNTMQLASLDPIPTNSTQRLVTLIPGSPPSTNIPEPASMALVGMGLLGLGVARRMRRRTLH